MQGTPTQAAVQTEALFVSDVHLHPDLPQTTRRFLDFLRERVPAARQLYLLGDIFEYWAGDDDLVDSYNGQVVEALRKVCDAGVALFWVSGNRDFLVGADFAQATGATLLPDPSVVSIAGQQIVLAHGDAQCTDDVGYMAFREQVRQPSWQKQFLERPLDVRKRMVADMRSASREAQRNKMADIMDVNPEAVAAVFAATGTTIMVHGHTHRPGRHEHVVDALGRVRYVLPDWDCDTEPPRGGWISIDASGDLTQHGLGGERL